MYLFRARVVQLFSITATAGTGLEWGAEEDREEDNSGGSGGSN